MNTKKEEKSKLIVEIIIIISITVLSIAISIVSKDVIMGMALIILMVSIFGNKEGIEFNENWDVVHYMIGFLGGLSLIYMLNKTINIGGNVGTIVGHIVTVYILYSVAIRPLIKTKEEK